MQRASLVWWAVGVVLAIAIVTISVPHIAKEEGPLSVFLFGGAIGAGIVYGVIDHRKKRERGAKEFDRERR